jgi:putative hydrolase of the HAD superfamily
VAKSFPPLWLFDLDNTLHDASHAIFPAISANMNVYIARILAQSGLPATQAAVDAARLSYWKRYGATLLGMMHHHAVQPAHFLHETHVLSDLPGMMRFDAGLGRVLRALPGRKILLTNAPMRYSSDVMHHLRLARHFDRHIAIEDMHVHRQLRPKPSTLMLGRLLRKHRADPRRCILVEDTLENLRGAKKLGMRTVWVTQYLRGVRVVKRPGYVDVKVKSVRQLGTRLRALGAVS